MLLRSWIVLVGGVVGPTAGLAGQTPLAAGLDAGPWSVGFATRWELDASRPFSGGLDTVMAARPVRIDLWYPTTDGGPAQTFEAYLEREDAPAAATRSEAVVVAFDRWSYGQMDGSGDPPARLLAARTAAIPGARPADGPFPLVVYAGGWYSRSTDNTVLAEHLASHGFVVATTPHLDRGLWAYDFSIDASTLETRARDLGVAARVAASLPFVDRSRVAAGGYSSGAIAALMLGSRDEGIDALFGLDPSYLYDDRSALLDSDRFRPGDVLAPLLTLYGGTREPGAVSMEVVDLLTRAERWTVAIPDATHGDFSDDVRIEAAFDLLENDARPSADGARAYTNWLELLTTYLEGVFEGGAPGTALREAARARGLELSTRPAGG